MDLPKLTTEQHAQILGYAIIGYGISFLVDLVVPIGKLISFDRFFEEFTSGRGAPRGGETLRFDLSDFALPGIVVASIAFLICLLAGVVIKKMEMGPKPLGPTFALFAIGFYPLGTILSFYTLVYLFVIAPRDAEQVQASSSSRLGL